MSDISGTSSTETLTGGPGNDTIDTGGGNDTLYGGAGDDTIFGYTGSNWTDIWHTVIYGEDGNDTIYASAGNDQIYGGAGDDAIQSGDGANTIDGGSGNDSMSGGNGNDHFVVRDLGDKVLDSGGVDSGVIYVDFYKPSSSVENWTWAPGVQRLPYWIDAVLTSGVPAAPNPPGSTKTIYFAFPTTLPSHFTTRDATGFLAFNDQQKSFARQALSYISSVIDVRFVETTDAAAPNTIAFANNSQDSSAGYAYSPAGGAVGSGLFLDKNTPGNLSPSEGDYSALTMIHELSHALGLKHPFSHVDASGDVGEGPYLPAQEENTQWTVESYTARTEDYYLRLSPFDIAALQYVYGPSKARTSNDTYTLRTDSTNFIWDGAGTDTVDGSAIAQSICLNLEPGYWGYIGTQSSLISTAGQITVNFGTTIENANGGSGDDRITGNGSSNGLCGNGGNDVLCGGAGNDVIDGGSGTDTASFAGNRSTFTIMRTSTGYRVSANAGTEGTDSLIDIERIAFGDGTLHLEYSDVIQQLYVSYFGRAADSGGLTNFTSALAQANAPTDIQGLNAAYSTNATIRSLVDAFGTSAESNALYTGDTSAFVSAIYRNVLGRDADAGGMDFWRGAIDGGNLTKGNAALSIMAGALANTSEQGLLDAALIHNKIRAASNFTFAIDTQQEVQGYSGNAAAATVRSMLSALSTTTNIDDFQTTVYATLSTLAAGTAQASAMAEMPTVAFNESEVQIVGATASPLNVLL